MCHHKTKKKTRGVQNFSLNNDLKLIEPKRYVNYFEDTTDYSYLPPIEQYKRHILKIRQMKQIELDQNFRCSCMLNEK